MTEEKLLELLNDLTLEEKIGQMTLLQSSMFTSGTPTPFGPLVEMNISPEQMALAGCLGCNTPPEPVTYAQIIRDITKNHPHHIPPLMMRDVIHGFRTIFPLNLAVGCTFDEKYAEIMGRISAIEGAACGLHLTLGPMMDVIRDPRWGRVLESPSESPEMVSAMSVAAVKGFRGEGIDKPDALATCAKHFAAYGLCQAGQEYAPIDVSRSELYNIYLKPFKAALDAGCDTVMTSFVAVDRVPCVCNDFLQNKILRQEWGHNVMTVADYDDVKQLMNQGVANDLKECAELAVNGGLDVDFLSLAYLTQLKELVEEGKVSMETIDKSCYRILKLKNDLGLFENPVKNDDPEYAKSVCACPEHLKMSLETALRSCVLMKNNGTLPIKSGTKVALVGSHVDEHDLLGAWAVDGIRPDTETIHEAFIRENRITLTDVENSDVILFTAGEFKPETGEAASKAHPELKPEQIEELKNLAATGKPVVLILICGRPLILTEILPYCDAILNIWFPGSMGAEATRQLIMGDTNPSGHLSMTFPRCVGQIPIHHDRLTTSRPFGSRGKGRAFTNAYIDEENEPLYPFGFGLSYTNFELSDAVLNSENVKVTVKNTGEYDGETVIQIYGRVRKAPIIRPLRTLIGWKRIAVPANSEITVEVIADISRLNLVDCNNEPVKISGEINLYIGFDSTAEKHLIYNL